MKDVIYLLFDLLAALAKLLRPGGGRSVKDTVRRILAVHYKPDPANTEPSWLTTLGHAKDSLWSVDLFRAESITLKSHWIMVVMDQYNRRIIGVAVHGANVD